MAGLDTRTMVTSAVLVVLIVVGLYILDPSLGGLLRKREGFVETMSANANYTAEAGQNDVPGKEREKEVVGNPHSAMGANAPDQNASETSPAPTPSPGMGNMTGSGTVQGFADLSTMEGPAAFGDAEAPAGCYPRDQLTPAELLPRDPNSVWAQQNPMGTGSLKGKNFLSAGALIGINTVGQSLRNANWQIRSEPPNPQVPVSVFYQSTIEPDVNRRTLEIN
jgi:hypothetical protein